MAWESIAFTNPPLFVDALTAAQGGLAGKAAILGAIPSQIAATPEIDASGAAGGDLPLLGNGDLYQYATAHYRCVFVHPWCQGIGEGVGHYRSLAPANAVEAVAEKFTDANDSFKSAGNMDVLALLIAGKSNADLHTKLERFLAVFSRPEIYMCSSRCRALASIEDTKQTMPDAAANARWKLSGVIAGHYVNALGNALSVVDGYACDSQSAEDEIALVADKKAALINEALNNSVEACANIVGGVGSKLFLSNKSPTQIKRALLESGAGYDSPLSVCLVLAGDVGSLEHVRGLF